ncbi:MAG: prepilin-type N-terminal cleavage/methylation domain-containing protein [Gammaproteobacteria bacterium]|nr:prepilin-type N-terminal cleavage/methylation domain-containing protein [Gammaproteobacteria bacterium]MCF6231088.1 prepilin-type N-terminal cleavage/methylation domain-containing protein [Gammaproteobacteria bacterium]
MRSVQYQQGFTLIELMVSVAIVAIIASIAYPAYTDSVIKSGRADATTALLQLQMDQEKHRANNPTYATAVTGGGANGLSWSSDVTEKGYYTIAISAADAASFTATATVVTGTRQEADAACQIITVDQDGAAGDLDCW